MIQTRPKKLNPTLIKIVSLLSDGQCHDGETLGTVLHITRSGVWKAIRKLIDYGVNIQIIKGKGYYLSEPVYLLDAKKILKKITMALQDKQFKISVFETIDSTITYLKSHPAIQICLAEHQSAGRGRLHRHWHSPFGKNIYLSMRFSFHKDISALSGLSLIVGLAVIHALKNYGLIDTQLAIKWPNDVIYDNKKLAGILIDIQAEAHGVCEVIISVGLNVNMRQAQDQAQEEIISQSWTSLYNILGHSIDRNNLCAQLIGVLIDYVQRFNQYGLAIFMAEWRNRDGLYHRQISLDHVNQRIIGVAKGINPQGHLLLQLENGAIAAFSAGEATLCKSKNSGCVSVSPA